MSYYGKVSVSGKYRPYLKIRKKDWMAKKKESFPLEMFSTFLLGSFGIRNGKPFILKLIPIVWFFIMYSTKAFFYLSLLNLILFNFIIILYIFKHRHLHCPWQHLGPRLESLGFYWTSAKVLKKYVSISDQSTKNKLILEGCMWN